MRRFLLLAVCFLTTSVLLAGPVSREQAQQAASSFMAGKQTTHRASSDGQMRTEVVFDAVDASGQPYLYAVTMGQDNGFVIVSGDDRYRSVLGYSLSGTFDNSQMPSNMRAWLQGYVDQMRHLDANGYQPQLTTTRRASGVKKAISPFVATQWNQDAPYNNLCKDYFVYKGAVTGCVATAMAQVIYYTAVKNGQSSYIIPAAIPAYKTRYGYNVPAVPAGTEIKYSDMLTTYTSSFSAEQGNAVATLMLCCGVSVEMDYANSDNGGSSASTSDVPAALKTYFGIDQTARFVNRGNYSYADWVNMVYDELSAQRPVLYGGQSSGGGHAFVVDGYDGDELFHVNWGWGGWRDNYFALSVLNPDDNSGIGASTSNDGYSFGQDAVIGIQMNSGETYEEPKTMSFQDLKVTDNTISAAAWNWTGETNTFDYGYAYMDEEGNIEPIQLRENKSYEPDYGTSNYATTIEATAKPAGTYKIVCVSKLSSASEWVVYKKNWVSAVFDGSSVTLTLRPFYSLTATDIAFPGSKYVNEDQTVDVTIQNNADEFYGVLYLFASKSTTKGSAKSKGGTTIQKGATTTMQFQFKPTVTGTFNVWVATDDKGDNVIGSTTVDITTKPAGVETTDDVELTFALKVVNAEGSEVIGKTADIEITVTNDTDKNYEGEISILTWKWVGVDGTANTSWVDADIVPAHSTVVIKRKSRELTDAEQYSFTIFYDYQGSTKRVDDDLYKYYTTTDGYTLCDANGNATVKKATESITVAADVAYVDLRGQSTVTTVASQANANTLFLVDEGYSLSGATNIVEQTASGYHAANIALEDNAYGLVSPVDFTAGHISYTRTFSTFYNAGAGWSTLVLPFAATTVTNSAGNLPWDEANRKFWLMEYINDSDSKVFFATASSPLEANTPYIIALPGADQGSLSLVGKNTLTFAADNVLVTPTAKSAVTVSYYKFVGTMTATGTLDNIYALNAAGDKFKKGSAAVAPFRAYFAPTSMATATSLSIGIGDGMTTGIETLQPSQPSQQRQDVYNVNGQRVSQPTKGLYIVNGKKVIVK